jgi:hypothetical protein
MREFEALEAKSYRYTQSVGRRLVAAMDLFGEIDSDKISGAIRDIKRAVDGNDGKGKIPSLRVKAGNDNAFGLLQWGNKICFNLKGEPSMAIYEMQYNYRKTTVFIEMEKIE